jgi:5-(carboxyamino)imidazole ribonucleotide mutase
MTKRRSGEPRRATAAQVGIVMGSDSDAEVMFEAARALEEFGIGYEMEVCSAHRTPQRAHQYAHDARQRGLKVIIAGAGGAAHLAGVMAAGTTLPVIAVPLAATPLGGLDALLASVQMPAGVPVGTVAIGKMGARNAGLLAVEILAVHDEELAAALARGRADMVASVAEKNRRLQARLPELRKSD